MKVDQTRESMESIWIFDILKEEHARFPDGLHMEQEKNKDVKRCFSMLQYWITDYIWLCTLFYNFQFVSREQIFICNTIASVMKQRTYWGCPQLSSKHLAPGRHSVIIC